MMVPLVMVSAILAALVLGFLCGRIWQIRCDELRAGITPPRVARIPHPKDIEPSRGGPQQQHVAALRSTIVLTGAARPIYSRNRWQLPRRG